MSGSRKILIVDDEAELRLALAEQLALYEEFEIVKAHPRRIRVIYIRSVDPNPSRISAIDALIADVQQSGTQLVLAADSEFAAAHAAADGLISARELARVHSDKSRDERARNPNTE